MMVLQYSDKKGNSCPSLHSGQLRAQESLGPLKISLEMAQKVICPQEKKSLALSKLAVH
jgi:hypothetical protein